LVVIGWYWFAVCFFLCCWSFAELVGRCRGMDMRGPGTVQMLLKAARDGNFSKVRGGFGLLIADEAAA
jgi:hypothetical protein